MGRETKDCIHLNACRRLKKLWGVNKSMKCNLECSAYVSGDTDDFVLLDDACDFACFGADRVRSGENEFNVYAPQDLDHVSWTLGELVKALQKKRLTLLQWDQPL